MPWVQALKNLPFEQFFSQFSLFLLHISRTELLLCFPLFSAFFRSLKKQHSIVRCRCCRAFLETDFVEGANKNRKDS